MAEQARERQSKIRTALEDWLARKLGADGGLVHIENMRTPEGAGHSNETILLDAAWQENGRDRRRALVARLQPSVSKVFDEYDLALQYRVMDLLGSSAVPVPRLIGFEDDATLLGVPFYVMESVSGQIPPDRPPYHAAGWVTELAIEQRRQLWWSGVETMAKIHVLDWRAAGFGFLAGDRNERTPLERQLADYEAYLRRTMGGREHSACEAALDWMHRHRPAPREPVALCWGDARLSNMIFVDCRCVAVLDWEMITLGNPLQDLAWWITLDRCLSEGIGLPRLEGLPGRDETAARWAELTRLPTGDLRFYEVFAAFRFAAILARIGSHMKADGEMPPDSDFDTNNLATQILEKLLVE